MKINLADNLKRLRTAHGITQETLADFIGVSSQAVSKWERGDGLPDITILPSIANYFDVSLDELLGMEELRKTDKLEQMLAHHRRLRSTAGKTEEDVALLREILALFPNNYYAIKELAEYTPDYEEGLRLCGRILEFCTDNELRDYAAYQECCLLDILGRREEALAKTRKLPGLEYCRELNIDWLLDGEERARECQNTVGLLVWAFYGQMEQLEACGLYTPEQRLTMYRKALDFVNLVYDTGDLFGESIYAYKCNFYSALICMENGMADRAVPYLKQAMMYAKAWDTLPETGDYTSLLTDRLRFDLRKQIGRGGETVYEDMYRILSRRSGQFRDHAELTALFREIEENVRA